MSLKGMKRIKGKLRLGSASFSPEYDWSKYDDRLVESVQNKDLVKLKATLGKKGVSCVKLNEEGSSAVHFASMSGAFECLKTMLKTEKPNLSVPDLHGRTALHLAARGGHLECMDILLEHGIPVDFQDTTSMTALHYAVSGGHKGCVDILLKYGAPVNLTDKEGRSPLLLSIQSGHEKIFDLLLEYEANVNIQDNLGKTALIYASEFDQLSFVRKLIAHGARVSVSDFSGRTAATYASENHSNEIAELLQQSLGNETPRREVDINLNTVECNNKNRVIDPKLFESTPKEGQDSYSNANGESHPDSDSISVHYFPELEGTFLSSSFGSRRGSSPDPKEVNNLKSEVSRLQEEVKLLRFKLEETNRLCEQTGPSIPLVVYQQLKVDNDKVIRELNYQIQNLKEQLQEAEEKITSTVPIAGDASEAAEESDRDANNDANADARILSLENDNTKLQEENQQLLERILELTKMPDDERYRLVEGVGEGVDQIAGDETMGDAESKLPEQVVVQKLKYEQDIDDLHEQNKAFQAKVEDLERKLTQVEEEHQGELAAQQESIRSVECENTELKTRLQEKEEKVPQDSSQMDCDKLKVEVDKLKEENGKLRAALVEQQPAQGSEDELRVLRSQVGDLQAKCDEINRELIETKSTETTMQMDHEEVVSSLRRELTHLKEELKEIEEERMGIKQKYDDQVEENRKQIDFYENELSVLEVELQNREDRHAEVVNLYRTYLLSYHMGCEDEKLDQILSRIVRLRKMEATV